MDRHIDWKTNVYKYIGNELQIFEIEIFAPLIADVMMPKWSDVVEQVQQASFDPEWCHKDHTGSSPCPQTAC